MHNIAGGVGKKFGKTKNCEMMIAHENTFTSDRYLQTACYSTPNSASLVINVSSRQVGACEKIK